MLGDQAAVNAEELRKALDMWKDDYRSKSEGSLNTIHSAARSWLALLEGDEATVEKVAVALWGIHGDAYDLARRVLAAITGGRT